MNITFNVKLAVNHLKIRRHVENKNAQLKKFPVFM